jgi:GntR family transcriptional regulator
MKLKKGPIPLYYQLERALRKRIRAHEIDGGIPFPTERDLCDEYGVSRTTVRQALMILEREGLLKREQGRGTFVNRQPAHNVPFRLHGYMDDLFLIGAKTSLELTRRELITLDAASARDMELDEGDEAYLFEGVRRFNGEERKALFRAWVPRDIGEKISLDAPPTPFLVARVEQVSLERVSRANQRISAAVATAEHESVIDVTIGDPILIVKHIYYSASGTVLEVAETHFPGDAYQPAAVLERVVSEVPIPLYEEQEAIDEEE